MLCLAFTSCAASAQTTTLVVDGSETAINLQTHAYYLRDPQGKLDIDEVRARDAQFLPANERRDLNFSYTRDHLWLRVDIVSAAPERSNWMLEMRYASLDKVSLFSIGAAGMQQQHAGDTLPYSQRSIGHRNPVFSIELEPGEQRSLYILAHSEGSLTLDSQLWNATAFHEHSQMNYVLLAVYFGMLLALASYNLMLFAVLGERSFALYVCFVVSFGIAVLAINGLGPQYIWPNLGEIGNRILPFFLSLAATVGVLFAQSFLDTARRAESLNRFLSAWAWIAMVSTLLTLVLEGQRALQLMSVIGLLTTLVLFVTGILCVLRRIPGAFIFVLAWLMLLAGGMLLALRNFSLIPSTFLTVNAMQIGSAMEMLLLSLGLAARFNELKRLKESAQQQALKSQKQVLVSLLQQEKILEQRVAERTDALAQANARLELLAMQDPLTGLANRTALTQHLQQAMLRTERRNELLALVLIDLDSFKAINDELGHDTGDQVLEQVAARLTACARETDLAARLGGDEFILISEGILDQADALRLGERLLDALSLPIELQNGSISVGASIGISLSNGVEPDIEALMRHADQAMYLRKRGGRNGVMLYNPEAVSPFAVGNPP
tara:strand:- start:7696 stop:9525 length:1830 start_codon:yes stop_codon:yes gene_type:complete